MQIPEQVRINQYLEGAYFCDCHSIELPVAMTEKMALDVYLKMARNTPDWVDWLMSLRNQIVSKLGLKNLGKMSDFDPSKNCDDYHEGDQIGIFSLLFKSDNEVILEDKDKHLDAKVSFYLEKDKATTRVYATTLVHVKNPFGKLYMFFVAPMHKMIVPRSLKTLLSE